MWRRLQDIEGWICMSRIRGAFENKKGVIGFLTAGDPSLEKTEAYILELERAGAAAVEIGLPFSDPVGEGAMLQAANVRALSALGGCNTDMVFALVERVRRKASVPLLLCTYLNPVFSYGYAAFCERCRETGIVGLVVPDLPYEERAELETCAAANGVELITIIAPARVERVQMLAKKAKGCIYLTLPVETEGQEAVVAERLEALVAQIRAVTDVPVVVEADGYTPALLRRCGQTADGIVIRNALAARIAKEGERASFSFFAKETAKLSDI